MLRFSLSVGLSLLGTASAARADVPAGIVSWWKAAGDARDSVGTNDGILTGGTLAAGEVGEAFRFSDASDYVDVGDQDSLDPGNGNFTVEAWIRTASIFNGNGSAAQTIVAKRENGHRGYILFLQYGLLNLWVSDGRSLVFFGDAGTPLDDDTFHHVAGVLDRTSTTGGRVYVDGIEMVAQDATMFTSPIENSMPFCIGKDTYPGYESSQDFTGSIDEVSYYNRALSRAEILSIFTAGPDGKGGAVDGGDGDDRCRVEALLDPPGLVSWWTAAGNAQDSAGTNHGTLKGGSLAAGEVGQAFRFSDANDYVDVGDQDSLDPGSGNVSVEAWVRTASPINSNGSRAQTILAKRENGHRGYILFLQNGMLNWWVSDGTTLVFFAETSTSLADNTFHHVAAVLDRTSRTGGRVYVDGVELVSQDATMLTGTIANSTPFRIGKDTYPGYESIQDFTGSIDEVSYYNRALNASEVRAIYRSGAAGKRYDTSTAGCDDDPCGDVTLLDDDDVAAFGAGSNVECIGDLVIGGDVTIVDLPVVVITGDVTVVDAEVLTILALPDLTTAGSIDIEGNDALVSLAAPVLKELEGDLLCADNDALPDLALPELKSVSGDISVSDNDAIVDIALPALENVGGDLDVSADGDVDLSQLTQVGGDLVVATPDGAVDVSSLDEVGGELSIDAAEVAAPDGQTCNSQGCATSCGSVDDDEACGGNDDGLVVVGTRVATTCGAGQAQGVAGLALLLLLHPRRRAT